MMLYRTWGIRPHEHDQVSVEVLRLTEIAFASGLFDPPQESAAAGVW